MTRYAILDKPIPQGGFGRTLTRNEYDQLRTAGVGCTQRWIVVRQVSDIDRLGICYSPVTGGGYTHAGIYVETKH